MVGTWQSQRCHPAILAGMVGCDPDDDDHVLVALLVQVIILSHVLSLKNFIQYKILTGVAGKRQFQNYVFRATMVHFR